MDDDVGQGCQSFARCAHDGRRRTVGRYRPVMTYCMQSPWLVKLRG